MKMCIRDRGVRPQLDTLEIDPCIPRDWDGFTLTRQWRGAEYQIQVENPNHVSKGVKELYLDNQAVSFVPVQEEGSTHIIRVVMG